MTTAVCVKTGPKYSSEYVNILAKSLIRNGYTGKLTCITDDPIDLDLSIVNPVIMPNPDYSWWDKLYLYSWEHGINDSLLYFDLDMVIVGSIECFIDWSSYITGSRFDRGKFINSTLIAIPKGYGHELWVTYNENREKIKNLYDWDSKYLDAMIESDFRWDYLCPDSLVSYKFHVRGKGLPLGSKVVSFHGKPNPNEVEDEFVQIHWK